MAILPVVYFASYEIEVAGTTIFFLNYIRGSIDSRGICIFISSSISYSVYAMRFLTSRTEEGKAFWVDVANWFGHIYYREITEKRAVAIISRMKTNPMITFGQVGFVVFR